MACNAKLHLAMGIQEAIGKTGRTRFHQNRLCQKFTSRWVQCEEAQLVSLYSLKKQ